MTDEKHEMTVREMGRKGGEAVREKYGAEHFSKIGKLGGRTNQKRGREYFQRIGRLGGLKRSHEQLVEMARKGGQATKKKKEEEKATSKDRCPECRSENIGDLGVFEGWLECHDCKHVWKEARDGQDSHSG